MFRRTTGQVCLFGASALAIAATPALAQVADDNDENIIIVSANKREQTLQETPIAITAVTAEQVELRGISETKDLSAVAPNVAVSASNSNMTGAVVTIRGIPTPADETQGFDSPIGLYIDGVYLARSSAASFEIADIERIEVLRGPQGTLFGRNTTGGAINYITSRPSDDASLKVKLGYGNYNQQTARLILNTGDRGGVRVSAGYVYKSRDGVVDNLLEPRDSRDPGSYETHGVRVAVEADLTDNLLFTNIFDWTQTKGVAPAYQLVGVGDGVFRPNRTVGGFTFPQVQPANVGAYLAASTTVEPGCPSPLASLSLTRLDEFCNQGDEPATDRVYGNMTRFEWQGDSVLIRSTTAFRWWRNRLAGSDIDGLPSVRGAVFSQASLFNGMPASLLAFIPTLPAGAAPIIAATPVPTAAVPLFLSPAERRQDQFSQEVEIIGGTGTSLEWVVGGFFFKENGFENNPQNFGFVLDTNQAVFTDAQFGPLGAGFRAANPARYRVSAQQSTLGYRAKGKSYAIYGQGTWRPAGPGTPFGVTVGLRYTWDEKEFARFQNGLTPYTSPVDLALNTQKAKFSQPTGHVTLDYQPTNRINIYAKAARGYRSGGFNARQSTQQDDPATPTINEEVALIPFAEEKIDSFEIGGKFGLGRLRLNLAAFHNIYKDQQVSVPIPIQGGGSFGTKVDNAGKTKYTGFEIEAQVDVTDNLRLDGAFGYVKIDPKQVPFADINGVLRNVASIFTPTQAPEKTASLGAAYVSPIGSGDATMTARVGWNYVSEMVHFANPLSSPFQAQTSSESRSLINAQLRFDDLSIGDGTRFSVLLWGKNIANDKYVSRSVDFGQLGFATANFGDPATYGVTVELTL